jgi:chemotaxis protein MotB
MRARRQLVSHGEGLWEIWPSFTDVMSTLALILFVLVLLAFVRSLISAKRMDVFKRQIATSEARLRTVEDQLHRTTTQVEAEQGLLKASEDKLHAQAGMIEDANREVDNLRSQLQSVAVLRVSVLNKLKTAIESQLRSAHPGAGDLVRIGNNGNVVINESLVFELNSYAVKPEGKPLLDALAVALANVLADAVVRENVDSILIQGHTDERGSDSLNWELSAKRANAVLAYLFAANPVLADSYGKYFAASAYSKYRPLDPGKTETAYRQNRRIEIAIVPKDTNLRKVIDEYVQSVNSTPQPAVSPPKAP